MLSFARTRFFHEWKVKQLAFREYARRENIRRYNRQRGFIINPYAFGTAGGDPSFASVISLAHFDGTGGDTGPFDDVVRGAGAWTRHAVGAQLSATAKYGATALSTGNVGVYNPDHADWDFGSGAFTLEFWCYWNSLTSPSANPPFFACKGNAGSFMPWMFANVGANLYARGCTSGSAWDAECISSGGLSTSTWFYVTSVRSGTNFYAFLDGVQFGGTQTLTGALMTNSAVVSLGTDSVSNLTFALDGIIDDWRATKGDGRYTAGFTPPASAHPDS